MRKLAKADMIPTTTHERRYRAPDDRWTESQAQLRRQKTALKLGGRQYVAYAAAPGAVQPRTDGDVVVGRRIVASRLTMG